MKYCKAELWKYKSGKESFQALLGNSEVLAGSSWEAASNADHKSDSCKNVLIVKEWACSWECVYFICLFLVLTTSVFSSLFA